MTSTRDRIVTAAGELFRRQGYNGTGLKDVVGAAGATIGSLYHFFPGGKGQLAAAVITESGAAYQQLWEMIADESTGAADAIANFFAGAGDALAEGDYVDCCPIGTVAAEIASTDEQLRATADAVFRGWTEAVAARLRGDGLPADAAVELGGTIVAALQGAFLLARCRRDSHLVRVTGQQLRELVEARLAAVPTPVSDRPLPT